jgi:hypothetical protein
MKNELTNKSGVKSQHFANLLSLSLSLSVCLHFRPNDENTESVQHMGFVVRLNARENFEWICWGKDKNIMYKKSEIWGRVPQSV